MGPNQVTTNPTPTQGQPTANSSIKPPKGGKAASSLWAILAVVGIAAAVVFAVLYFSKPEVTPSVSVEDDVVVTDEETKVSASEEISSEVAQNIINPYVKEFYFNHNVLDFDFDEIAKAELAYLNIAPSLAATVPTTDGSSVFRVNYYDLNQEYQKLFGSNSELAKQNFSSDHTNSMEYDAATDSFTIRNSGSGGTGMTAFSIAKSAKYTGSDEGPLVIEVYHDQIPLCDINPNDGYCYTASDLPLNSQSSIIQKHSDQISVYTMTFAEENGHYILSSISK